ncbi:MAG: hypothetical protein K8I27_14635 [Planctomycetes bacterium]|nr:hypothetical protein [Planctomycetota bacterium]
MDALLSRDGIIDAKTDIAKAEVYLLGEPGTMLKEDALRRTIEDDFGYGLRSYKQTTESTWEDIGTN